jgi:hypothetical protein
MIWKHILTLGVSYLRQQKWWKKGYGVALTAIIILVLHFIANISWSEIGTFLDTLKLK